MASYLLDTNICITLQTQAAEVLRRFESLKAGDLAMSL